MTTPTAIEIPVASSRPSKAPGCWSRADLIRLESECDLSLDAVLALPSGCFRGVRTDHFTSNSAKELKRKKEVARKIAQHKEKMANNTREREKRTRDHVASIPVKPISERLRCKMLYPNTFEEIHEFDHHRHLEWVIKDLASQEKNCDHFFPFEYPQGAYLAELFAQYEKIPSDRYMDRIVHCKRIKEKIEATRISIHMQKLRYEALRWPNARWIVSPRTPRELFSLDLATRPDPLPAHIKRHGLSNVRFPHLKKAEEATPANRPPEPFVGPANTQSIAVIEERIRKNHIDPSEQYAAQLAQQAYREHKKARNAASNALRKAKKYEARLARLTARQAHRAARKEEKARWNLAFYAGVRGPQALNHFEIKYQQMLALEEKRIKGFGRQIKKAYAQLEALDRLANEQIREKICQSAATDPNTLLKEIVAEPAASQALLVKGVSLRQKIELCERVCLHTRPSRLEFCGQNHPLYNNALLLGEIGIELGPIYMSGTLSDFKYQNIRKRFEWTLLSLLSLLALGQLSWIAAHRVKRIDCSSDHRYSLGPETMAYIAKIPDHVDIIVTLSSQAKEPELRALHEDLRQLLEQYVHASKKGSAQAKIRVEWVDIYQQRARAQTLVQQYHLQKESTILVVCGERVHQVTPADLYKARDGQVQYFSGEAALTSAIAQVITGQPPVVYFLEGHAEMRLDDTSPSRGASQVAHLLAARSITCRKLDLRGMVKIPEDASAVVIAGARGLIEPAQVEMLSRYLDHAEGSVLVYLDPLSNAGLEELFERWGILADPWIVIDTAALAQGSSGDCVLRRFAKHPITEPLLDYQLSVLGSLMRVVRPDPAAKENERIEVVPLIGCSPTAFAKRPAALQGDSPTLFDPLKDLPGPLTVAMVSQRRLSSGLGLELFRGRLVVFGDESLISNRSMQLIGNETLFVQTLNWLVKSGDKMTIDPKRIAQYRLSISGSELMAFAGCVACVAALLGAVGLIVAWKRRA